MEHQGAVRNPRGSLLRAPLTPAPVHADRRAVAPNQAIPRPRHAEEGTWKCREAEVVIARGGVKIHPSPGNRGTVDRGKFQVLETVDRGTVGPPPSLILTSAYM